jgi:hypothetical protein
MHFNLMVLSLLAYTNLPQLSIINFPLSLMLQILGVRADVLPNAYRRLARM